MTPTPTTSSTSALANSDPTDPILLPDRDRNDASADEACAASTAKAELQTLELAFAFDVSGSMGKGDEPYHDKSLKWDPIVEASVAFFESNTMSRVSASLVFFPIDADEDERCDADSYDQPDVELQALPSNAFREAIAEITPDNEDDWRGGTPTLAVLEATLRRVNQADAAISGAKRAVVLVTDGTPQDCSDEEDSIENVAEAVAQLRNETPVYVVGVANPSTDEEPEPPDNVSNLALIAQAGGTEQPYLIDTGDPQATIRTFTEAVDAIRREGLSCEVAIPAPPSGMNFDVGKVNVTLTVEGNAFALTYSADCADPDAWYYDDEDNPTTILLCANSCERTKASPESELEVEFGCERRAASVR